MRAVAITALLGAVAARSSASGVATRENGKMSTAGYVARVGLAGSISCSVTHSLVVPLDNVKTRMQTMPDLGPVRAAAHVVREKGYRALLNGLRPTMVGYWLQGAAKFGGYEALKLAGRQLFWTRDGEVHEPATMAARLPLMLTAAGIAEMGACLLLCPLETGAHPLPAAGCMRSVLCVRERGNSLSPCSRDEGESGQRRAAQHGAEGV